MSEPSDPAEPESFEAALAELEGVVQAMEAGKLPLERSLDAYERGMLLLRYCQQALDAAERKVQVLARGELEALDEGAGDAR